MIGRVDLDLKLARKALSEGRYRDAEATCIEALKKTPNNANFLTILGEIAWRRTAHAQAFELFRKAHLIDPDLLDPIIGVAKAFILINDLISAREAAERALELRPRGAENLYELGQIFRALTDEVRALALFEQAVTVAPKNIQYLFALGMSRQINGDVEGAERAMRRCLEIDSRFTQAYFMLVDMKKQTSTHNFIPILEKLFSKPEYDLEQRLAIAHALAKSHEDIGDPLAAMSILEKAKDIRRRTVPYDRARTQDIFEQATGTFPSSTLVGAPNGSDAPIFVFGMPRSGTTLTDRILSSHPRVRSVGEIQSFANAARGLSDLSEFRLDDPEIFRRATSVDVGRLAEAYLKQTSVLLDTGRRFVDKFPHNFLFAGLIHRALPNARLICLRRDPIDVCLSNYRLMVAQKSPFHDYVYSLADIGHYYLLFDQLIAHWTATLRPDRFMSLHYESLVANQELETRRLLDFCDLPWDGRCLAFHENTASVATPSLHQVRKPMFTTSIGRWRRYGDSLNPLIEVLKDGGLLGSTVWDA